MRQYVKPRVRRHRRNPHVVAMVDHKLYWMQRGYYGHVTTWERLLHGAGWAQYTNWFRCRICGEARRSPNRNHYYTCGARKCVRTWGYLRREYGADKETIPARLALLRLRRAIRNQTGGKNG